jgi:ssDNA-binding Zn-finger/Zn-ribbon topoisomerase 1
MVVIKNVIRGCKEMVRRRRPQNKTPRTRFQYREVCCSPPQGAAQRETVSWTAKVGKWHGCAMNPQGTTLSSAIASGNRSAGGHIETRFSLLSSNIFTAAHSNVGRLYADTHMGSGPTKMKVYDHHIVCPYCRAQVVIRSLMEQMFVARRSCPVCNREMLIHDSLAVNLPTEDTEQPSRQSAVPRIESSERMMLLILRGEGK